MNARLASQVWKVGVEWSNVMKRDEIEGAVTRLMASPKGKEMLQRAVELKDEIKVAASEGSSIDAVNGLVNSILSVNANHVSQRMSFNWKDMSMEKFLVSFGTKKKKIFCFNLFIA